MTSIDPKNWARQFAADLILGEERVPFDRVLRAHADAVANLRAQGLTWASLARLLARAGARRSEGKTYSADHLRISFQRFGRAEVLRAKPKERRPTPPAPLAAVDQTPSSENLLHSSGNSVRQDGQPAASATLYKRVRELSVPATETDDAKDISSDEIGSVLDRLGRTNL